MKVLFVVNNKSKTSIPLSWYLYVNKQNMNWSICIRKYGDLYNMIREFYYADIVHGHHVKSMFITILLNIFFRKPTVYTIHGSSKHLSKFNLFCFNFILRFTDRLVFVNKILYEELTLKQKDKIIDKYEVILNGVELNMNYIKHNVFKKYALPPNKKYIFHPARFVKEKNHIRILTAFKNLLTKKPNLILILAGDGVLRKRIENKIKELGINKNVFLLGTIDRDEVYNFLEKSELFIMPSISEGLNIAYLEALSMHCKMLVSDIKQFTYPLCYYNLDPSEINIFLCNPLDVDDLERAFSVSLDSQKNRGVSLKEFSLSSMIKKYRSTYLKLLKKNYK